MIEIRTALSAVALAAVAVFADAPSDTIVIDRWLVAVAAGSDSLGGEALGTDILSAPGEVGVLPDRGSLTAGVTWRLLRGARDALVGLDSVRSGEVVYAHSYLESSVDQTVVLEWEGAHCVAGRAWLNGREVRGSRIRTRLGAGWNTLLLKLVAGDCPFEFMASVVGDGAGGTVRSQASRPPGDVRTGPEDWVIADDTAGIAAALRWKGDRLYAGLAIGLTAWGRAPVSNVRLELRGGPDGSSLAPWLVPGAREEVVVPVRLDQAGRAVAAGSIEVRTRWSQQEEDRRLVLVGPVPAGSDAVVLEGWEVNAAGPRTPGRGDDGGRPNGAGWILEGEWKVPDGLAGRSLVLAFDGAPADYRLDDARLDAQEGRSLLCDPCRKGQRLRLTATSEGAWTQLPTVRVDPADGSQ